MLGHAPVGVLGIRPTELKHAIGLTKLNYLECTHAPVGVLGSETVGVLKNRPWLSHRVSHCVETSESSTSVHQGGADGYLPSLTRLGFHS